MADEDTNQREMHPAHKAFWDKLVQAQAEFTVAYPPQERMNYRGQWVSTPRQSYVPQAALLRAVTRNQTPAGGWY